MNRETKLTLPSRLADLIVAALSASLISFSGASALASDDIGDARAGELIYRDFCVMCHSRDGRGVESSVPDFNAADSPLVRNEGLLTRSDDVLLQHILHGFADDRVTSVTFDGNKSDSLTLPDLRNVLAYLHVHFHYQTHATAGEQIYNMTCIACHGANGKGAIPGIPDLGKMDGVMAQSDTVLLDHILNGFESPDAMMQMPPRGSNFDLTIGDLQDVLDYLHQNFQYRTYNGN